MSKYLLAHDLGTTGNKSTLFREDGKMMGSFLHEYGTHYFNDTWVEQDPEDWWNAVCATSKNLIAKSGINSKDIAAISFSGQMMGCLCVDRNGKPLRPSIIWADQRAQKQAAEIAEKISMWDYYNIVGHRNSASYGLQKLMWVRDNEPEIYANTYKVLNSKDYIVHKLTGVFATEQSDAGGFACYDLMEKNWSARLLEIARIDPDKFPTIYPSTYVAGGVSEEAAALTGLYPGTPVVLGGGDGLCANIGTGSIMPGRSYSYVGSSSWIATTSEKPIFDEKMRFINWPHIVPGMVSPNGTMQMGGGSYSWLKDVICTSECEKALSRGISPYDLINAQIEESTPGANGVIFLPYLLGERAPRWNVNAKACFLGMRMETKRPDMLRSVLEGVTMNLSIILQEFRKSVKIDSITVIGGGAKGTIWRQIMADIYQADILVPSLLEEATSMGAAVTGGVGCGLFSSFEAIDRFIEIKHVHKANEATKEVYNNSKQMFNAYYDALCPVFDLAAKLR